MKYFFVNLPTPTSNSEPATKEYVDGNENSGWVKIGSFNGAIGKDEQKQVSFNNIKNIKQIKIVGTVNKLVTGQYKSGFITISGLQIAGCQRNQEYNKTANINSIANVVNFPYCSESNKVTIAHAIDFITYSSTEYTYIFTNILYIYSTMQVSVNLNIDIYLKYYD